MERKQELQTLLDALQYHTEQTRFLQSSVKRVLATKKDSEQQDQALSDQIDAFNVEIKHLQEKMEAAKSETGSDSSDSHKEKSDKRDDKKGQQKKPLKPEDQENVYQLKALMMPQIHSQNKGLQGELTLFNRRNELRSLRKERQVSYNKETNLSVATTHHILNMHERRAREAEKRAEALQAELDKRDGKEEPARPRQSERPQSQLPQRQVEEILKKNQILTDEGQDQRREIQRLKKENADLVLKVKHSSQDRDQIMSQLSTSEMARKDLYARFQRQKTQHDKLSRSLTRQSTDWIEARKQRDQEEEEQRWRQVGHAAPHGAQSRTFSHPVPRSVDQPRNMFPVKDYAQPTAA